MYIGAYWQEMTRLYHVPPAARWPLALHSFGQALRLALPLVAAPSMEDSSECINYIFGAKFAPPEGTIMFRHCSLVPITWDYLLLWPPAFITFMFAELPPLWRTINFGRRAVIVVLGTPIAGRWVRENTLVIVSCLNCLGVAKEHPSSIYLAGHAF